MDDELPAYDHKRLEAILGCKMPEATDRDMRTAYRVITDAVTSEDEWTRANNASAWIQRVRKEARDQGWRDGIKYERLRIARILGIQEK